jgi:hypothetical protein
MGENKESRTNAEQRFIVNIEMILRGSREGGFFIIIAKKI